jgi:hypothetical protein
MSFANQKEAVFSIVLAVFSHFNVKFEPSKTNAREIVDGNASMKEQIIAGLVDCFQTKQAPLESPQEDLKKYCVGLLNNWLRRDTRLNGGIKYQGKVGNADPSIREARKLLNTLTDESQKAVVAATIEEMVAAKKKSKEPTIDVSKLPESLKKFAS